MSAKPLGRFRRLRIAVSVFFGVLTLALVVLSARSYLNRDPIDAFQPKVGMTVNEVKTALGEPTWEYSYSDSGEPIPGERFRTSWELGYGEIHITSPSGGFLRKHRLLLRFEGWRVWDDTNHLVQNHPLQLKSWNRSASR